MNARIREPMRKLCPQVRLAHAPGCLVESIRYPAGSGAIPRHSHAQYQISLCESGVGDYLYRHARHHAPSGSLQIFQPDEAHAYLPRACAPDGGVYRVFYVDPEYLRTTERDELGICAAELPVFAEPMVMHSLVRRDFLRAHTALLDAHRPVLERDTRLLQALVRLLRTGVRHGQRSACSSRPPLGEHRAVRRARDYLVAHSTRQVTLTELAQAAGLSAFRLTRLFTQRWGLAPHAFQLQIRVNCARAALRRGEPPSLVAADCGFVDQAHLSRVFKRLVGVAPGAYANGGKIVQDKHFGPG